MNKMIQIRNVPEKLHRKLKARAAAEGMTLTDYVARLIDRDLAKPSLAEMAARLRKRTPVVLDPPAWTIIRQDRDSR
jgi:plasmid stability protein